MVAPGGRHLVVRAGRLHLTTDLERHSCRPSVDVLFESVALEHGASAAACLLTGMGKDGALGLLRIQANAKRLQCRVDGVSMRHEQHATYVENDRVHPG